MIGLNSAADRTGLKHLRVREAVLFAIE